MISEAQRLREQAARCLRLVGQALPDDVIRQMRALAADCLERAQALEKAANQQQQQVANVVPPQASVHDAVQQQQQQQQQIQPDKAKDSK
jgi:hypothetical protein